MNIKEIRELIKLIEHSNVDEFEMERSGVRIRIRKTLTVPTTPRAETVTTETASPPPAAEIQTEETPEPEEKEKEKEEGNENYIFKAPIIGTFYLTPKPDAEPLVQPGDQVSEKTILCIIEAMKIFNQIECDREGEIIKILVENGQPVEYGQPLFEIKVKS